MATKTVSVNPGAAPITGVTNMCAGGPTMYVADADTPSGSWSSTLVTVSKAGLVGAYVTGVGVITYTLPTGCFTTTTLTVNALPLPITGGSNAWHGQHYNAY